MDQKTDVFHIDDESKPYTHLNFKNDPEEFQFAIVSDNAGGGRPGVFHKAVEMVNLLQPEFVACLGDLVEGYNDASGQPADEEVYRAWWQEIDESLAQLDMPFFFLPGNHDLNSPASVKVWRERHGGSRAYYHFIYKNVLFLMVNTEDPPKDPDSIDRERPRAGQDNRRRLPRDQASDRRWRRSRQGPRASRTHRRVVWRDQYQRRPGRVL